MQQLQEESLLVLRFRMLTPDEKQMILQLVCDLSQEKHVPEIVIPPNVVQLRRPY